MEGEPEFEERLRYLYVQPVDEDSCRKRWIEIREMYDNKPPEEIFDKLMKRVNLHREAANEVHLHMAICNSGLLYELLSGLFVSSQVEWRQSEIIAIGYQMECGMLVLGGTDDELYGAAEMIFRLKLWLNTTITSMMLEKGFSAKNVKRRTDRVMDTERNKILLDKPNRMETRRELATRVYEGLIYLFKYYEKGLKVMKMNPSDCGTEFFTEFYKRNAVLISMLNKVVVQHPGKDDKQTTRRGDLRNPSKTST